MANRRRMFKVAEKIRAIVANELFHVSDARFHLVTITSVVVSSDLREAKIYWNTQAEKGRREEVEQAFKAAAGHFRYVVGKDLGVKFAPLLKFFYDDTLDVTDEVRVLMERVEADDTADGNLEGDKQ